MKRRVRAVGFLMMVVWYAAMSPVAFAQHSSPNYKIEESQFGSGSVLDAESANYKAHQSTGDLAVGSMSSANYDGFGGFLSQNEIYLEMQVQNVSINFGTMDENTSYSDEAQGGDCNCSFYVRTYLSSGYGVYTMSQPPTNEGGTSLTAKSVLGAPSTASNVEEFGINLVDNATPNIGADFANQPDDTFADGQIATGYDTPDQFKYGVGDLIAESAATATNPAIGTTEYTISYVMKPSIMSRAGTYTLNHDLVAVATY